MGALHIPLSGQLSLSDIFSQMPDAPKSLLRRGFSIVAKLPESAHSVLLKEAVGVASQRKTKRNEEQLAKTLNISVEEASSAIAALGMLSALASTRSESVEGLL